MHGYSRYDRSLQVHCTDHNSTHPFIFQILMNAAWEEITVIRGEFSDLN